VAAGGNGCRFFYRVKTERVHPRERRPADYPCKKWNEFTLHAVCGRGEEGEKNTAARRIGNLELVRVIRDSNRLNLGRVIRESK
jgi:hypothetical protein